MLAEAVTSLFAKSWRTHGASRLSVMLKMNRRKFSQELIDHLVGLLHGGEPEGLDSVGEISAETVMAQLRQLAALFRDWHATYERGVADEPRLAETPLLAFINRRMIELEQTLLETGFQPDELAALTAGLAVDSIALAEMQLMVRETRWQVSGIVEEARRRWSSLAGGGEAIVESWIGRTETLLVNPSEKPAAGR